MSCIEYTDETNYKANYLVEDLSAGATPATTRLKLFNATAVKRIDVELQVPFEEFQAICRKTEIPSFTANLQPA